MNKEDKFDQWIAQGSSKKTDPPKGYLEGFDDLIVNQFKENTVKVKRLRSRQWMGAVAASLLIFVGFFLYMNQSGSTLTTDHYALESELEALMDELSYEEMEEVLNELEDEIYQVDGSLEDFFYDEWN